MGVKDLWSVLTPYAERKPIYELRGKTVAIDLAGWVCESLNVVDYFVHPRHHLKNLFFRTCYLVWEEVTPVFVLEGVAPKLKNHVIAKRNEIQFRGVKPKEKSVAEAGAFSQSTHGKGRTRFNHVLKQCENLLQAMGIQCVQAPGEAEAYCAFLNKKGLVDGIISQDSDCFAYGALRVYRNFSVSTQGAQAAQGGAVDIYDMGEICKKIDFGQNKIIVMALFCGCDYCPDGIGGIGRDGVLKFFNKYKEMEILKRLRSWRLEDTKYSALEMRVDDKTICTNCGHLGRTQSHTKNGCGICRSKRGCDESLWKEERLSLKTELMLRKKALIDPKFPNEEIITEFLSEPATMPVLNLSWQQPNIVKFIKQVGNLLQWTEIYCFQKFFPILTRWQVRNVQRLTRTSAISYVEPKEIVKKRNLKGVPSLELIWEDNNDLLKGLIPDEQLKTFALDKPKGLQELWSTIEPLNLLEQAYPDLVEIFMKSKEKPKKVKNQTKTKKTPISNVREPLGSLENLDDLLKATEGISKSLKPKRKKRNVKECAKNTEHKIDKQINQIRKVIHYTQCSTPRTKSLPSDLEESDFDDEHFNMSAIVSDIVKNNANEKIISQHAGYRLHYDSPLEDISLLCNGQSLDDMDLMTQKRNLSISMSKDQQQTTKRISLDDSFDVLVNTKEHKLKGLMKRAQQFQDLSPITTHIDRFKQNNRLILKSSLQNTNKQSDTENNVSFFFNQSVNNANQLDDVFEQLMEISLKGENNDLVLIEDSDDDE